MTRSEWILIVILVVLSAGLDWVIVTTLKTEHPEPLTVKSAPPYDGDWWLSTTTEAGFNERLSVLEGIGKCRFQVARSDGWAGFSYRLADRIDRYYARHPRERSLNIYEVWHKLGEGKASSDAEVWEHDNDEEWWRSDDLERLRYVEGYLWCMRNTVKNPTQSYSREASFYVQKINQYYEERADTNQWAPIETILSRYQDEKLK